MSIKEAIARSIHHTENVTVRVADMWEALNEVKAVFSGNIDSAYHDHGGSEALDVWGWTDKTPENESDFRLTIRLAE